jgi:hypothetical protein
MKKFSALYWTLWRARFGRHFGPVVKQTTKWMNTEHEILVPSLQEPTNVFALSRVVAVQEPKSFSFKLYFAIILPSLSKANYDNYQQQIPMKLSNHMVAWLALLLCVLNILSSGLGQQTGCHRLSVRVVILCPSKYIRGGTSCGP